VGNKFHDELARELVCDIFIIVSIYNWCVLISIETRNNLQSVAVVSDAFLEAHPENSQAPGI
jgi:hypothetical protein